MGSKPPPVAPDPMDVVRQQQGFNREAMTDAARRSSGVHTISRVGLTA